MGSKGPGELIFGHSHKRQGPTRFVCVAISLNHVVSQDELGRALHELLSKLLERGLYRGVLWGLLLWRILGV